MDRESGSVEVGAYLLEVGNDGSTVVQQGEGGDEAEIKALRRALERPEPKAEEEAPVLASEIDEAAEATSKIEQAAALCKGAAEGHALDPDHLALEVGMLLDCLERLDRGKKHKQAIQLARSLSTLLMLLKRWASLLQTLRIALRAGRELGDEATVAWAEHELGTLKLAAGDVEGAEHCLGQARQIRQRLDDGRGLSATNRNMQVLCDQLQTKLRNKELVANAPRAPWPPPLSLVMLLVALFGAGVAAGVVVAGDPAGDPVAETRNDRDAGNDRAATVTTAGAPETVTTVKTVTDVETVTVKVGREDTGEDGVTEETVEEESAAPEEEEGSSP
jgi:tetratricopeptide (TPR) repeat protein